MKKIIIPIGVLPINDLDNENIVQTVYNDFIKFMQFNKLDPKDVIEKKYTIRIYSIISRIQFFIDNKEYLTKEQISYLTEYIAVYKVNIKRYYEIICSYFDDMAEELMSEPDDNKFDEFTTEEFMAEIERRNNK